MARSWGIFWAQEVHSIAVPTMVHVPTAHNTLPVLVRSSVPVVCTLHYMDTYSVRTPTNYKIGTNVQCLPTVPTTTLLPQPAFYAVVGDRPRLN